MFVPKIYRNSQPTSRPLQNSEVHNKALVAAAAVVAVVVVLAVAMNRLSSGVLRQNVVRQQRFSFVKSELHDYVIENSKKTFSIF